MPNPFPGMDPYLEGPRWPSVHGSLVEEVARQLAPKIRPKYLALTNERITVTTADTLEFCVEQVGVPNVGAFHSDGFAGERAAASTTAPLVVVARRPENVRQTYIEIRAAGDKNLVTAIEVLSFINKRGAGLAAFCSKRLEFSDSPAHYLEIDLLRTGQRYPVVGTLPSVPYFVFLSRANQRPRLEVWPIALDQPLPTVPVPLLPDDPDVKLDLQQALHTIYDLFGYDEAVDHRKPPRVPLPPEQTAWVEEQLKEIRNR